jgi:hypothetical protein
MTLSTILYQVWSVVVRKLTWDLSTTPCIYVFMISSSAGAETTAAVMSCWLLAMDIYPEIQKRAQAELRVLLHWSTSGISTGTQQSTAQTPAPTVTSLYEFGRTDLRARGSTLRTISLFIDIAMMLWACTIEPAKDANGHVIPIDVDRTCCVGCPRLGGHFIPLLLDLWS